MYIGILQAALNALGLIMNKKIISNTLIGDHFQIFFMRFFHVIILSFLVLFGFFEFKIPEQHITFLNLLIIIIGTSSLYFTYLLRIVAYRNEKVSTLQPFAMLYQVLPPIISFIFITSERSSIITFIASLIAGIIILYSSINLKTFKVNRYSGMILLSSLIKSVHIFSIIYFISIFTQSTVYIIECFILIIISSIFCFGKKEFTSVKQYSIKYFLLSLFGQTIILSSILLSLTMFKSFGVILTSLIGLLYLVFSFLFGYIFSSCLYYYMSSF